MLEILVLEGRDLSDIFLLKSITFFGIWLKFYGNGKSIIFWSSVEINIQTMTVLAGLAVLKIVAANLTLSLTVAAIMFGN